MAVLPPDPVYSFKADMGYVHSICFPSVSAEYCDTLLASTESGKVYFWDLEVILTYFTIVKQTMCIIY